jgi:phosphoglycerol transferase MdoB-like AlkP superfamily enzyme
MRPVEASRNSSFLDSIGLFLLALGFCSLSLVASGLITPEGASKSFARDPFVNLVLSGFEESTSSQAVGHVEPPAVHASLSQTQSAQKRNVVLIHLESTRAESTTPYNSQLQTMPFLNELAKSSLLAQNDYTTVPHTSKAVTSVNCGIEPHLVSPTTEAEQGGIPAPCLPSLLKEQGYTSVFFQSSTEDFEDFKGLVKNFGYEEYYPLESMSTQGFKQSNYFGYEDDIMLKPSQQWLETHKEQGSGQEPFVAEYLLGTGHHDYKCLGLRYGDENFSNEEPLNSYLNCLNYQDHFLENLINQYKSLGLYENTIFVIYGDHGEGFGEHGRFQHDDTIYEEGLKVPLLIHAPGLLDKGERVEGLTNHADILPTVLDLLGYKVQNGEYPGYSLVAGSLPQDRQLNFSCFHEEQCMASIKGSEKYIYNYGNQPDEVYDLSKDPQEKNNLASQYSKEELDQRREDLLNWRASVNATY